MRPWPRRRRGSRRSARPPTLCTSRRRARPGCRGAACWPPGHTAPSCATTSPWRSPARRRGCSTPTRTPPRASPRGSRPARPRASRPRSPCSPSCPTPCRSCTPPSRPPSSGSRSRPGCSRRPTTP
ncbi:hypothetical protein VPH35_084526 [Triticum aestivum]